MFPVYNLQAFLDRLTAINAASYPPTPNFAELCVFTNDVVPDLNMTPETFEIPTADPFGPVNIVMGNPTMNDQGAVVSRSQLVTWETFAGDPEVTVYGVVILNAAGNKVIAAQRFNTPQILGGPLPQSICGVWRNSEPLSNYGWLDVEA